MDDSVIILRNIATLLSSAWEILSDPQATIGNPKFRQTRRLAASRSTSRINLHQLANPSELTLLPPIRYAYDPLPSLPRQALHALPLCPQHSVHGVDLDPLAAGLPYRSSLNHVRASKYWDANFNESVELLKLLAEDDSAGDITVKRGITMNKLARKALQPGLENQMILAQHYMFPNACAEKMRHIAALTMLYFIFDDKVEETPDDKLRAFRDDFLKRFDGQKDITSASTAFRDHITSILDEIDANDAKGGEGGKEMVEALRGAFRAVHPDVGGFSSIDSYLDFRRTNVGADFVIAAAKYSIQSPLSLTDPSSSTTAQKFAPFLHHLSNHYGIVNDLASYDKEVRALAAGQTDDMINLVDVIKQVTGLVSTNDAKAVAFALQCQTERAMVEEIEGMKARDGGLSEDEERLLDALILTATGNAIFCMTTSRYGGEAARI